MTDIKTALNTAIRLLNSPSERVDAEVLLAHVLQVPRAFLFAHPEQEMLETQLMQYEQLVRERSNGSPIAYLVGLREFWSLPLSVSNDTLIPRPETELLVEVTLKCLAGKSDANILDLGTGTGAVALALASERPYWNLRATDISSGAIRIARKNADHLHLNNITFYISDWFKEIPMQTFDAIISNPPYIAQNDPHLLEGDLRFEPVGALVSGYDGLDALRHLIRESKRYLDNNGFLLVEHGFTQQPAVQKLFEQAGYQNVQSWKDIQNIDRVTGGWHKI
jgi:release factor glutamine methyltransferase